MDFSYWPAYSVFPLGCLIDKKHSFILKTGERVITGGKCLEISETMKRNRIRPKKRADKGEFTGGER